MKKVTIILTGVILMTIASLNVNAQAPADATAKSSATIVTTLAITKDVDLNFGNIAVTSTAGTVILAPAVGSGVRTVTGGAKLPVVIGTVSAAHFNVVGEKLYAYTISLPAAAFSLTGPGTPMEVGTFTCDKANLTTCALSATGADDFFVGATISVANGQAPGLYENTTGLKVTVNYN